MMLIPRARHSLANRITISVLAFSLVLTVFSAIGLYAVYYKEAIEKIESDLGQFQKTNLPGISASLWVVDNMQLQIQLNSLLNIPFITKAWIESEGQTVLSVGNNDRKHCVLSHSFPLDYFFDGRVIHQGNLHLTVCYTEVYRELLSRTYLRLLFQIGQIIIVAIFMLLFFRVLVLRRLSAIEDHISTMGAEKLGTPLTLPKLKFFQGEDELDHMAMAFSKMSSDLKNAFGELNIKQQQLEALNLSLEDRIKDAVLELREKDRIMLQQARLATMGEMIGIIAHQWRQPLNNIGLYMQGVGMELEMDRPDQAYINRSISDTMETLNYLSKTIDDFRNFFLPEREKTSFSLSLSLEQTLKLLKASFEHCRICLKTNADPEDIRVTGHPNELAQAIMNIVLNSKDAHLLNNTPEPWVSLSSAIVDGQACIWIEDNAGGIPQDILEKIFDPYFSTKHQSQGTGLGLYIAKMIIENSMKGYLTVASTAVGSIFTIRLPLEEAAPP